MREFSMKWKRTLDFSVTSKVQQKTIAFNILKVNNRLRMNEESSIVKPLYHYSYRNEGTILDQQYNYQGNILAVANSNGDIILYSANNEEQNRERIFCYDRKKGNERKYAVIKIAWSLPIFSLFAAATINRDIELYQCKKNALTLIKSVRMTSIPLCLAFCPIEFEVGLAVGTSRGTIILLSQNLTQLGSVVAHEEGVTCLAWDHKILSFQKNKWIMSNFSHIHRYVQSDEMPQLISGSSDQTIKIWRLDGNKLIEMFKIKAHLKAVRDIQWRNTYLQSEKYIISCSEDGTVKIWKVKNVNEKITDLQLKQSRSFGGPVYKANFNFLGNLIAISFCNQAEQKVETIIMKQKNGAMMGEQIKIHI